jgi:hypothetical protein
VFQRGHRRSGLTVINYFNDYPAAFAWKYDRAEIIAEAIIHALGVSLGSVGAIAIDAALSTLARSTLCLMVSFSFVAGAAVSERDLARLCAARRDLPLHRGCKLRWGCYGLGVKWRPDEQADDGTFK